MARHGYEPLMHGWYGWVFPLLVAALLAAVAVMLFYLLRRRPDTTTGDDPLRAAAMRMARGEITVSEFDQLRGRLEPGNSPSSSEDTDTKE